MNIKRLLLNIYFLARFPFLLAARAIFALSGRISGERIGRILLIRPDRLGDLIVSLPVARNIRDAYPRAELDIIVSPSLAGLAVKTGLFSEVLEYCGFWRSVSAVRRKRYDIVIDLVFDYTVKTALLAGASGAAKTIGFALGGRGVVFSSAVPGSVCAGKTMCDIVQCLLGYVPAPRVHTVPVFPLREPHRPEVLTIGIHPGGYYPSQRWPAARFAGLALLCLRKLNARIIVIGGELDRACVEEVRAALGDKVGEAVYPETGNLPDAISRCSLLVCNNSGPLHLAAARGVPTVSVMGPTDPVLWMPAGNMNRVIRKGLSCSPCSRPFCKSHRCLNDITEDEVFGQVRDLLVEAGLIVNAISATTT